MSMNATETPTFTRVRKGGYDPPEVDAYIGQLQAEIGRLQATIEYMSQDVASLREMAKHNEQPEAVVGRALLSASSYADEIVSKAQQQAQEMIDQANRILHDAQVQADIAAREQLRHLEQMRRDLEQDIADLQAARSQASAQWLRTVAQYLFDQADELVQPLADRGPEASWDASADQVSADGAQEPQLSILPPPSPEDRVQLNPDPSEV